MGALRTAFTILWVTAMLKGLVCTTIKVDPEWVDYNGHMNLAYYVLAFDKATDDFYDALGIGFDYRAVENTSMFTLGINVDYQREVFAGDTLKITTQLLDVDTKRMRYIHAMYEGDDKPAVAFNECLAIHVNMASRKSDAFPKKTQARVNAALAAHKALPLPVNAGRVLGQKL